MSNPISQKIDAWLTEPEPQVRLAELLAPGGILAGWERGLPTHITSATWQAEVRAARESFCAHCGRKGLIFLPLSRGPGEYAAALLCPDCGHAHY